MSSKESAKPHEPAMQRSQPEQTQQASPEAAQLNLSAQMSAASPPPVNPNTIAQLQRIAGNQAVSRMLMHKPTPAAAPEAIPGDNPAIQRHIVGTTDPDIWANEIGNRVFNEQDQQIKDAVTRLHSLSEPIFVASYDQLVANIKNGKYDTQLKQSSEESPKEAKYQTPTNPTVQPVAALIGQLSNDYGGALSGHPLVAQVWAGQWNQQQKNTWKTAGIREVLNMFLYFYTNADIIHNYFSTNKQLLTLEVLQTLHSFFVAHLGAGMGGTQELNALASGALKFNTWFKEGLDAAEHTLNTNKNDSNVVDSYVTFNLDNETKQYFRKLIVAKDPPGGARVNQNEAPSLEEQLMRLALGISNSSLYLPMIYQHMKEHSIELSKQSMLDIVGQISPFVRVDAPSEQDVEQFITEKQKPEVVADLTEPLATIANNLQLLQDNTPTTLSVQIAMQWRRSINDFANKVIVVSKKDQQRYVLVGVNGMNFLFKKA